jgi:hypothetical protein
MTFRKAFCAILLMEAILASCNEPQNKLPVSNTTDSVNYITANDTTGLIMKEMDFWVLIDKSRTTANNNYQAQINSLKNILLTLDEKDIEKFDNTFTALLAASYDWKLWGAAYVINGGCSDDCFDYFRQYLIGHGKDKFYQTLNDPESCAGWIKTEEEDNWEGLQYAADEAYKQKTGRELPKTYLPKFELKGKPFDEETVSNQYPQLAKKFM